MITKGYSENQKEFVNGEAFAARIKIGSSNGVVISFETEKAKLSEIAIVVDGLTIIDNFQIEEFHDEKKLFVDIHIPNYCSAEFSTAVGNGGKWLTVFPSAFYGTNIRKEIWSTEKNKRCGIIDDIYYKVRIIVKCAN